MILFDRRTCVFLARKCFPNLVFNAFTIFILNSYKEITEGTLLALPFCTFRINK